MGAFLNSVHVRSDDFGAVTEVLNKLYETHRIRMVARSPRRHWISVFPEMTGSAVDLGQEMAKSIPDPLVHIQVFDDDVFQSRLYQRGDLINHLSLGSSEGEEQSKSAAKESARAYSSFLKGEPQIELLEALLGKPRFTFESERMEKFTRLLQIPDALDTYEDLVECGTRKNLRQFPTPESLASKDEATLGVQRRRGLLVGRIDLRRNAETPWIILSEERCLLIGRQQLLTKYGLDSDREEETGVSFHHHIEGIWSSPSGDAVIVYADGALHRLTPDSLTPAWSLPMETVQKAAVTDAGGRIAVSAGESSAGESIHFISSDGRVEHTIVCGWARALAVHPAGSHVLASVGARTGHPTVHVYSWGHGGVVTSFRLIDRVQQRARERFEEDPESWRRHSTSFIHTGPAVAVVTEFGFGRTGEILMCATPTGVELLRWDEVLGTSPDQFANAVAYCHPPAPRDERGSSSTFWCSAVAVDAASQSILMTGMESRILRWHLADNSVDELPTIPFRKRTARMALSVSLDLLACEYAESPRRQTTDPGILVWNYKALSRT